jgi:DNA ligase-1
MLRLEFRNGGVLLPKLNLWLDAHDAISGPEKVFVSHAHSDHTAAHREVILSAPTARLMQVRLPVERLEHVLEFRERRAFENIFNITLFPAGHIFGSAMSLIETDGESLLYTGDFKLRGGMSAEKCEPVHADVLIMETTFGRPQYRFPPAEDVLKGVVRFCREALDNDETAVLFGYSLGKSQEILCRLGEAGLPIMLHGTVYRLTQIYEQFGHCFPKYEKYDAETARGKVLVCPPNAANSQMFRKLGRVRSAVLTGWAVDPNCRYRYKCDAAFPLSDHADFSDLIEFVRQVAPRKVYTLHGFAADFARTLRGADFDATALSENEQLALDLGAVERVVRASCPAAPVSEGKSPRAVGMEITGGTAREDDRPTGAPQREQRHLEQGPYAASFTGFAEICKNVGSTSSKLEKIRILAEYLKTLDSHSVSLAVTWFSGRPFSPSQNKVLQIGWAVLRNALCSVANCDKDAFHLAYLKHSDVGETAGELLSSRPGHLSLTFSQVENGFEQLHGARGPLAKAPILVRLLDDASAAGAKFLVKIITGEMRIGLKEGLVEEAVAKAFDKSAFEIREANLLMGDMGETARLASENRLSEASLSPFKPVKLMLASAEKTAADLWARACEWQRTSRPQGLAQANGAGGGKVSEATTRPLVWIEDKYDGIRCQLHKQGERVGLYSRDLKDITLTFPELVDSARRMKQDFILDGEIVAMRGEEILPFAELQRRLGRKEADLFMRDEVPIRYVAFDLLYLSGYMHLREPLALRRKALETLAPLPENMTLARITQAESADEIEAAFAAVRGRGNEGLMVKEPSSVYMPGRRGLAWLKLKKALATLDCVVVGAEYGHGKRNKVLSDYTFAVRDEATNELKTIGKAYSGLTDVEIHQLTEHFLRNQIRRQGRFFEVVPDTVLEIAFDKVQRSNRHSSGLALRFPRIVRIRTDKPIEEIDTLQSAIKLAGVWTGQ